MERYELSTVSRAFIAGGIAACGAVTVTHGFETVKIRFVQARPIAANKHSWYIQGFNYRGNSNQKRMRRDSTEGSYTV